MGNRRELFSLEQALDLDEQTTLELHRQHLNPRLADLCELVGATIPLVSAEGPWVWDAHGRRYLDFVSGYASMNLGHNHPEIQRALTQTSSVMNLVEGPGTLIAALAHNLTAIAPGRLQRVSFANSGAEVVDAAVKLSRAATGRVKLVSCLGGFHGRTIGALSLVARTAFRRRFEPLLDHIGFVPYGDAQALSDALADQDVAGFIFEPVQGEGGMRVPPQGYLRDVRALCAKYGTLMVADEIQTGLGRTGKMFAVEHEDVEPDVLLLGKALGGGALPISAILARDDHWRAAGGGTPESPFQFPTFGGCSRSCAVALKTLEILIESDLPQRAAQMGDALLQRLTTLSAHRLVQQVRGKGLMIGIQLAPVTRGSSGAPTGGLLNRLSHEYLAGIFLRELRTRHGILVLNTLNDANVIRLQPPLVIGDEHVEMFASAMEQCLEQFKSFPRTALRSWNLLVRALRT